MQMMMPQQMLQEFPLASSACGATKPRPQLNFYRSNSGSGSEASTTAPATPATPATLPMPMSPSTTSPANETNRSAKGPISKLQEFVQSSKSHPLPGSCAVLQWAYENRMVGSQLQFMASVAFLLDGVPHHVQGGWWASKKQAQRDAAERSLCFFVGTVGEYVANSTDDMPAAFVDEVAGTSPGGSTEEQKEKAREEQNHVRMLELFCNGAVNWRCCWDAPHSSSDQQLLDAALCRATVEISCLGVPHRFSGRPCCSKAAAMQDTSKRALWYLSCPGYESAFEVVQEQVKVLAQAIPPPAAGSWPAKPEMTCCTSPAAKSDVTDMDQAGAMDSDMELGTPCGSPAQLPTGQAELLERKTTVMRLQNRLQRLFAKSLTPGKSVWCWRYERNDVDGTYQASVEIPLSGQTFTGGWAATHQAAQMEACNELCAFLDKTSVA